MSRCKECDSILEGKDLKISKKSPGGIDLRGVYCKKCIQRDYELNQYILFKEDTQFDE